MRTRLRAWMFGVMVADIGIGERNARRKPSQRTWAQAPGILPSGLGEAVDRGHHDNS